MPYPIKNTTAQQTNTVRTLNFAFGVNQGGYGLTSSTAFWNGKPPNVGGYVVYVGNGTSSPTMYTAVDDNALITLSNNLGLQVWGHEYYTLVKGEKSAPFDANGRESDLFSGVTL
jgi:hypothetical protein